MYSSYYKSLHYDEMQEKDDVDEDGDEDNPDLGSEVMLDTDDPLYFVYLKKQFLLW